MRPHVVHWLESLLPGGVASAIAPTWFTCVGLAGVVTLFAMLAIARRHRIDAGAMASIVLWCYLAAVAAGIVVPSAIDAAQQLLGTSRVEVRWAGMTSFWGYLAGGCAVALGCRVHRLSLRRFADLATAPLGIALVLARIGCFLAGCDYGKVSARPWAVRFPAHSPAWQDHVSAGLIASDRGSSLPVHPTQLYEAALGLAIAVIAMVALRRRSAFDAERTVERAADVAALSPAALAEAARRGEGRVFLLAAAIYASGRIAIEDLRGDAGRGIYLGLSSGQIFSLLVLTAIAAAWWLHHRRPRPRPLAAAATAVVSHALVWRAPDARAEPAASPVAGPAAAPPAPGPPPAAPVPPSEPPPGQLYVPRAPMAAPYAAAPPGAGAADPGHGAGAEPARASAIYVGALAGAAAPFNRRRDQVPTLAGGSLSVGFAFRQLGFWLDVDSLGNRDASHGTILASGSLLVQVSSQLWIGGRVGFGATLVNFRDPAFRDVIGSTGRFETLLDLHLGASWSLWLRPLAIDVLTAADLGGPIATWQTRIGLAYHFGVGGRSR